MMNSRRFISRPRRRARSCPSPKLSHLRVERPLRATLEYQASPIVCGMIIAHHQGDCSNEIAATRAQAGARTRPPTTKRQGATVSSGRLPDQDYAWLPNKKWRARNDAMFLGRRGVSTHSNKGSRCSKMRPPKVVPQRALPGLQAGYAISEMSHQTQAAAGRNSSVLAATPA